MPFIKEVTTNVNSPLVSGTFLGTRVVHGIMGYRSEFTVSIEVLYIAGHRLIEGTYA